MTSGSEPALTAADRERLETLQSAESLADLVAVTGAPTTHDAYFEAKRAWAGLQEKALPVGQPAAGLPGDGVVVDGQQFRVHGITHADTPQERAFLRDHISRLLDRGAAVYCEQGIRPMYFEDFPDVYEMDDYRWAMSRCERLDHDSSLARFPVSEVETVFGGSDSIAADVRDAVFSLIESGGELYGEAFERTLGDLASDFLVGREQLATGRDFESFSKTRRAATDPDRLGELQRYYGKAFLPQPVEREWLRRHDPELELLTHARNERLADYAVYHGDVDEVHLIVGAAHQPGICYYLERHRDGERGVEDFETVP